MSSRVGAWIGLGSNLDDPRAQVQGALVALDSSDHLRLLRASPLFGSAPMGPADQPAYVNAVAQVETDLGPHALLDRLQAIEAAAGRVRGERRWGPRVLDLDLLTYGDRRLDDDRLTLPHPGAARRPFVLVPWARIAPDAVLPGHGRVGDLAADVDASEVWELAAGSEQ